MEHYSYHTANPMIYAMLKEFARHNRKFATPAESMLWKYLRGNALGVEFRRQHIIGDFIADFACLDALLIIELDGGYHQLPQQQCSDEERTAWFEAHGYTVMRFANEEVTENIGGVLKVIREYTEARKYIINKGKINNDK